MLAESLKPSTPILGLLSERRQRVEPQTIWQLPNDLALFGIDWQTRYQINAEDFLRLPAVQKMLELNLLQVISDDPTSGQVIVAATKELLPEGGYDVFTMILPRAGATLLHAVDRFDHKDLATYFTAVSAELKSVYLIACQDGVELRRLYAYQHIAEGYPNTAMAVAPALLHCHWHAYGIPKKLRRHPMETVPKKERREIAPAYWDPTIIIAADLLRPFFPNLEIEWSTGSVVLERKEFSVHQEYLDELEISAEDQEQLVSIMQRWRTVWSDLAQVLGETNNGAYALHDQTRRVQQMHDFISSHRELSPQSQQLLLWLAESTTERQVMRFGRYNPTLFAKGIYGSIGYEFDLDRMERVLRVAPRAFAVCDKSGATGGAYRFEFRGLPIPDEADTAALVTRQQRIMNQTSALLQTSVAAEKQIVG